MRVELEMITDVVMTHFEVLSCKTSCRITGDLSEICGGRISEHKSVIAALTCYVINTYIHTKTHTPNCTQQIPIKANSYSSIKKIPRLYETT